MLIILTHHLTINKTYFRYLINNTRMKGGYFLNEDSKISTLNWVKPTTLKPTFIFFYFYSSGSLFSVFPRWYLQQILNYYSLKTWKLQPFHSKCSVKKEFSILKNFKKYQNVTNFFENLFQNITKGGSRVYRYFQCRHSKVQQQLNISSLAAAATDAEKWQKKTL